MTLVSQSQIPVVRSLLGPCWRWQLAQENALNDHGRGWRQPDVLLNRAGSYLLLCRAGKEGKQHAEARFEDIAAAECFWSEASLRSRLMLLVLGNCPAAEVANDLGVSEDIVRVVEALYFDIRCMLETTAWINLQVIMREADRGNDDLAAEMRLAFFGGRVAARALIGASQELPTDSSKQLSDATVLLHAKFQQALAMPLSPADAEKFLACYCEFQAEQQRVELERQKLTARMHRWSQRYELARERTASVALGQSPNRCPDSPFLIYRHPQRRRRPRIA